MEVVYSLRGGRFDSDQYYGDITVFTEEFLTKADLYVGQIVKEFGSRMTSSERKLQRTEAECFLDLIVLGTLWRVYSNEAACLGRAQRCILSWLTSFRHRGGFMRPGWDLLYGMVRGLFHVSPGPMLNVSLEGLHKLVSWLETTDCFFYEAKRLQIWLDYFSIQALQSVETGLGRVLDFAAWFEKRGEEVLGRYTAHVEQFRREVCPGRRWRENYIFCNRKPVEYHLNMVGAEMLNRVFRSRFLAARQKTVLLPACICLHREDKCRAQADGPGYRCAHCTPGCRANQVATLGKQYNFTVYIVPHTSSLFRLREAGMVRSGVVGIACVTNLLHGGWMLESSGIAAQCVLLDYCGCRQHWHKQGIPTDLNIKRLKELLQITCQE